MTVYYALVSHGSTGKIYDIEPLVSTELRAAKVEAGKVTKDAHSHDVLHVCTVDGEGQHHSVAARMVCRDLWVDSYPIQ